MQFKFTVTEKGKDYSGDKKDASVLSLKRCSVLLHGDIFMTDTMVNKSRMAGCGALKERITDIWIDSWPCGPSVALTTETIEISGGT